MVSPIPEVFADAKANQCGKEHHTPMEHLFKKLICQEFDGVADGPNMDEMMDVFWSEYDEFLSKSGVFEGHDYIWNASVLQVGESYKWHKNTVFHSQSILISLHVGLHQRYWALGQQNVIGERLSI